MLEGGGEATHKVLSNILIACVSSVSMGSFAHLKLATQNRYGKAHGNTCFAGYILRIA